MIHGSSRDVAFYLILLPLLMFDCSNSPQAKRASNAHCRILRLKMGTMKTPNKYNGYFIWGSSSTPSTINAIVNKNVELNCRNLRYTGRDGSPYLITRWTKYDSNIIRSDKYRPFGCRLKKPFHEDPRLQIRHLVVQDSGVYSCQVMTNDTRELVAQKMFTLLVTNKRNYSIPVKIPSKSLNSLTHSTNVTSSNERVLLDCSYYLVGRDGVHITWFFQGNVLASTSKVIPACGNGSYTCDVQNDFGGFTHTFNVQANVFNCSCPMWVELCPKIGKMGSWLLVFVLCALFAVGPLLCRVVTNIRKKHKKMETKTAFMYMGYGMYIESPKKYSTVENHSSVEMIKRNDTLEQMVPTSLPRNMKEYCLLYHQLEKFPAVSDTDLELVKAKEISRERLSIEYNDDKPVSLGSGFFGNVYKGNIDSNTSSAVPVAVKVLKDGFGVSDLGYFLEEATILIKAEKHPNVISLLGTCLLDFFSKEGNGVVNKAPSLLMELASGGNLRSYLLQCRSDFPQCNGIYQSYCAQTIITFEQLLSFSHQVALGMEHLSQKRILHRDLAARNILLTEDHVVKIGDFGLSKHLINKDYYRICNRWEKPAKWTSPEALMFDKYSDKSDIWSYGVLVWEILTLGQEPYPDLEPKDLYNTLRRGIRLPKPDMASGQIYQMMLTCWKWIPEDRTSFSTLVKQIVGFIQQTSTNEDTSLKVKPSQPLNEPDDIDELKTFDAKDEPSKCFPTNDEVGNSADNKQHCHENVQIMHMENDGLSSEEADDTFSESLEIPDVSHYDTFDHVFESTSQERLAPVLESTDNSSLKRSTSSEKDLMFASSVADGLIFENKSYVNSNYTTSTDLAKSLNSSNKNSVCIVADLNPLFTQPNEFSNDYCYYDNNMANVEDSTLSKQNRICIST
ncbi:uncharacterized protein LOC143464706 isoform X1 [Clavelina lepadiformis]|uniref:uncharacterized protein LOC143464706 isoform X1 n=2 Tax=Clavelina lepadiformis TaxID=159417 RepID=UPI0040431C4F